MHRPPGRRCFAGALLLAVTAVISWMVYAQAVPARLVALSAEPLSSSAAARKPTLTLALSVEFPTVGAQYLDPVYKPKDAYIGYFDAESCYVYLNDADSGLRRFDRTAAAIERRCGGAGFSGNFLNWAASSAIDVLRLGLTGGDRIVDTATLTVLQRAVLHNVADGNFAKKTLLAAEVADAVPARLRGEWTGDVVISNCLDRMTFGTGSNGSCLEPGASGNSADLGGAGHAHGSAALASDAFFYARVRVCESSSSGELSDPRATFCTRYPAGNFKPVGNLQKYSDRLRVAAFGYLMDDGDRRYGGVLRAPMKFVGPRSFDADGKPDTTNARPEWDEATGVFRSNPEDAVEGRSGVVNYLNQFGRTGSVPGRYKVVDPLGELYYEALRYLQGLAPTPQAVAGITDAMKDGFPAYARWDDPFAGSSPHRSHACVRDNILVIGDVNTHNDKSIPGNTGRLDADEFARAAAPAANEPDFTAWTRVVGGFEAGVAVPYIDATGKPAATSNPNSTGDALHAPLPGLAGLADADTGANRASFYMAGMAYWANTHDIRGAQWSEAPQKQRPGMRVTTYAIDVNEGGADDALSSRRQKQLFLAAKYGGFRDRSTIGNPFLDENGELDNKGWESGAGGGHPRTYHLSSSASAVLEGLDNIFASLAARTNALATGDLPTGMLTPGAGLVNYQASFDSGSWSGDVLALPITVDAENAVHIAEKKREARWSAADRLDAASTDPASRRIVVGRVDRAQTPANDFSWSAIEHAPGGYSLRTLLDRASPTAAPDGLGEQRLNFLRGDRSLEGGVFRVRASRLGDIVHSGIVTSGAPGMGNNAPGYAAFQGANGNRAESLFVGANDGMLHAFDGRTGRELFGYIPSWMGANLAALSGRSYDAGNHLGYVDATPRIAEAAMADGGWKTVLVGGTGAGGQGVFALDVTDPASFDASKVMWEFTDRDDPQMGNVIGRPLVAKVRISAASATGTPAYRSFAIVASGVNNSLADGFARPDGTPAIFLLDLSKPAGAAWRLNIDYFRLDVPTDVALSRSVAPGIVEISASLGPAGELRNLYAGDLHGNLWKLDFSRLGSADWTFAALSSFGKGTTALPLFVSRDAVGKLQPITMAPSLVGGPGRSTLVSFGTGKYLESADADGADAQTQSIYTLYDDGSDKPAAIEGRGRLMRGTAEGGKVRLAPFAWGRPLTDDDSSKRAGWYFDLPAAGERQIGAMQSYGRSLLFASLLPEGNAGTTQECSTGGQLYVVDIATGNGKSFSSTVGAFGVPYVLQVGASTHGAVNAVGQGETVSRGRLIVGGGRGSQQTSELLERRSTYGMLSWRRINNYRDLLHAKP
ncbi:pilus assembly protein [Variovorax sp. RHLX14]|uniref:pilus assembly protein n=1 Tax=Variovorax sp. RHLX14 TaxID=1259731 RepID=UPI003F4850D8